MMTREPVDWGGGAEAFTGPTPTDVTFGEAMREATGFYEETPHFQPATFYDLHPILRDQMVDYLQSFVPHLTESRAEPYVDAWAQEWKAAYDNWPTIGDAATDPAFNLGALKLPTYADLLPQFFIVYGQAGPVLYDNSYYTGPVPMEVPEQNWPLAAQPQQFGPLIEGLYSRENPVRQIPQGIPVISAADLQAYIDNYTQLMAPTGGGGGGRTTPTFDRRYLEQSIRDEWQATLLEQPANLANLVNAYIQEATSFYMSTGAQTNLGAWLTEQIHKSPRYRTLYGNKPAGMSEDEYLGRYQNVAQQFGLRPWNELAETEKGMIGAPNVGSFAERLSQSREYQVGHIGDLSRQFASTFSQLGVLRGS